MKLMRLTLAAAAGGLVANHLLKKARAASGSGRAEQAAKPSDRAGASPASPSSAPGGRADGTPTGTPSASGSDSPNAAERLRASWPANSLAGSDRESLDPRGADAPPVEYATSTGLSDFTRGA